MKKLACGTWEPDTFVPHGAARLLGVLRPRTRIAALRPSGLQRALLRPLWPSGKGPTVFDVARRGQTVLFVVSDQTRATAADVLLPLIVRGLLRRGCRRHDMSVLVATGTHRPPTTAEQRAILGARMASFFGGRVFVHDPDDTRMLVTVGVTSRGHSVRVNRRVTESDVCLLLGTATYHYHAGFGGGRKSLVPGLASRQTVRYNHSLTLDPLEDRIRRGVQPGRLDGNPVSEEMYEGAAMCAPDIIVNTVLTPGGEMAGVFSGHLDAAHRAACRLVERTHSAVIPRRADFVVASAGSATDWIQSHKALHNASRAVKPNGWVVLLAPCPEGLGNERFRYWMRKRTLHDVFAGLRKSPEVYGQTALSTRIRGAHCVLVTDMPQRDTRDLRMATATDVPTAVRMVLARLARRGVRAPTYYLMPEARHVLPFVRRRGS